MSGGDRNGMCLLHLRRELGVHAIHRGPREAIPSRQRVDLDRGTGVSVRLLLQLRLPDLELFFGLQPPPTTRHACRPRTDIGPVSQLRGLTTMTKHRVESRSEAEGGI